VEEERAAAMARRLGRTAKTAGLDEPDCARLVAAFTRVMERREAEITEAGHPEYLHPARTALILLDDAHVTNGSALLAAIAYDSVRPELTLPDAEVQELGGVASVAALHQLPAPGLDDGVLLETLVVADPDLLNVALAERLDHARHLHLSKASDWSEFHHQIVTVFMPAARRGHPMLARRIGRWAEAFEWRFLKKLI